MIKEIKKYRSKKYEKKESLSKNEEKRKKERNRETEMEKNYAKIKTNLKQKNFDTEMECKDYFKEIMNEYGFKDYNEMKQYIDELLKRNQNNKKRVEKIRKLLMTGIL
jgi:formate dehydrogenase maturation protein FdhE